MDEAIGPPVGYETPWFRAPTSNGQTLDSEAFHGKLPIVLFFLPRLGTPDDELVLADFDEHLVDFGRERVQLLGVAPCTPRELRDRADEQQLAVTLLADESGRIARSFGIPTPRTGGHGTLPPATVVIDRQGVIATRVPRTGAPGHAERVLSELRRLEAAIEAGERPGLSLRRRTAASSR